MRTVVALFALISPLLACRAGAPPLSPVVGEAASADGVTIRYEVRGSGEPALVLVHGWTNTRAIWGEHPRTLARSHRVVALDLAGHGESGENRTDWSIERFGDDVAAVAEKEGLQRVVLVGYSMGGSVVLEAARRMQEQVIGIVLVDAFHDPDVTPTAADAEAMEARFRGAWRDTAFLRAFAFTPDAPDSLVARVAAMMPDAPRDHWFTVLESLFAWLETDFKPTLGATRVPVALINTATVPTDVEAIRRLAPSATLDTLAGVGHAGILLQRVEDFDRRLLRIVSRFAATARENDR